MDDGSPPGDVPPQRERRKGKGKGNRQGEEGDWRAADGEGAAEHRNGSEAKEGDVPRSRGDKAGKGSKGGKSGKGGNRKGGRWESDADVRRGNRGDSEWQDGQSWKKDQWDSSRASWQGGRDRGSNQPKGQSKGQSKEQARNVLQLGILPPASLPGCRRARGGTRTCLVCAADNPSFVAYGSCGHSEVCWICTCLMRGIKGDRNCPMCKAELEEVILTSDVHAAKELDEQDIQRLLFDEDLGIRFTDEKAMRAAATLFEYRCQLDVCSVKFKKFEDLEYHLWYEHWKVLCHTCLGNRSVFLAEQHAYSSDDLKLHQRNGDVATQTTPALLGHPSCDFCNQDFYDEEQRLEHMFKRHLKCEICEKQRKPWEFYRDHRSLSLHYQEGHKHCPHPDCHPRGLTLVAFADEEELNIHIHKEHLKAGGLTTDTGLRVAMGASSYQDATGFLGKGAGRSSAEIADDNRGEIIVRFREPSAKIKKDGYFGQVDEEENYLPGFAPDSGDEGDASPTVNRCRFPDRELLPNLDDFCQAGASDDDSEVSDDHPARAQRDAPLDPSLERLDVSCCMADTGIRQGNYSALSAMHAVLTKLCTAYALPEADEQTLGRLVQQLDSADVEGLFKMQEHLEESLGADTTYEWEPLERFLQLRPHFRRLVHLAPAADLNAEGTGTKIGPRQGPASHGDGEAQLNRGWRNWKHDAQRAIKALGDREQVLVATYVSLCIQRRGNLAVFGGDMEAWGPSLGGTGKDAPSGVGQWAARPGGPPGRAPGKEAFPTMDVKGKAEPKRSAADMARPKKPPSFSQAFPTLGGGGSGDSTTTSNTNWGKRTEPTPTPGAVVGLAPTAAVGSPSVSQGYTMEDWKTSDRPEAKAKPPEDCEAGEFPDLAPSPAPKATATKQSKRGVKVDLAATARSEAAKRVQPGFSYAGAIREAERQVKATKEAEQSSEKAQTAAEPMPTIKDMAGSKTHFPGLPPSAPTAPRQKPAAKVEPRVSPKKVAPKAKPVQPPPEEVVEVKKEPEPPRHIPGFSNVAPKKEKPSVSQSVSAISKDVFKKPNQQSPQAKKAAAALKAEPPPKLEEAAPEPLALEEMVPLDKGKDSFPTLGGGSGKLLPSWGKAAPKKDAAPKAAAAPVVEEDQKKKKSGRQKMNLASQFFTGTG